MGRPRLARRGTCPDLAIGWGHIAVEDARRYDANAEDLGAVREMPKQLKRALREVATAAYEEELRRTLMPLAATFDEWRAGTISSGALTDSIHAFHNGPARALFKKYDDRSLEFAVAHAIVTGVIERSRVPDELLEQLKGAIEFYEQRE